MKSKACFASSVCCSDEFIELSPGAQALYLQLSFYADSDGAIDGIKKISRACNFGSDEVGELERAGLLLRVNGVPVIADWWVNNNRDSINYRPGDHPCEISMLKQLPNRRYYIACKEDGDDCAGTVCRQSDISLTSDCKVIKNNQTQNNQTQHTGKENGTNETDRNEGPHFAGCPECGVACKTSSNGGSVFGWCSEHGKFEVPCKPGERGSDEGGQRA